MSTTNTNKFLFKKKKNWDSAIVYKQILLDKQFEINIYNIPILHILFIHTNKFVKAKNSSPGLKKLYVITKVSFY